MPAILIQKGTKYACNLGYKGDQLCLQSWLRWGLNMPAISVWMGTKYACNLGSKGDQICVQYRLRWGPYMPAIVSDRDPICLQNLKIFKHLQSDRVGLKLHLKNFSHY